MGLLYWSIIVLLLGGCIGSFLNVLIYRWPRGLSARQPVRSFCPQCTSCIAWYDNLPVVSFAVLRGRCRHCGGWIGLQYPLVELATALVFLMTFDAFFVTGERLGIVEPMTDWPMLLAHWVLWAGLIALSVMDLEAYMVDIRITWILGGVGILAHGVWTPATSEAWIRPGPLQASVCAAAFLGLVIGAWLLLRRIPEPAPDDIAPPEGAPAADTPPAPPVQAPRTSRWLLVIVPAAVVVAYLVSVVVLGEQTPLAEQRAAPVYEFRDPEPQPELTAGVLRLSLGLAAIFAGLALAAGHPHAEADKEIVEAITAEAYDARRNALWELKLLSPALLLGAAAWFWLAISPGAAEAAEGWLYWRVAGDWLPLWGLSTGLAGWIIGGAIGWGARVFFTLLFGKEALGMGDVHILAAAGAIAGWPVAFLGFFLAAPLTLLAIVVIHLRRQSRAVPYGPWLALAFLITCIFQDRILLYLGYRWLL